MNKEPVLEVDKKGTRRWFLDGKLHRIDGPAVEYVDGSKEWWVRGNQHRLEGPAVERVNGNKEWWVNGKLHRLDGPAVVWADGSRWWYVNGKCHRLDGPAVVYADGSKFWYINDKQLTEEEFNRHPAVRMYKQKQQIKKDLTSNKEIDDDTKDDLESVLLDL